MIQFLKFDQAKVKNFEFKVFSRNEALKFFGKKFLYLLILIYSTFFLAVALPFVSTPCQPVYFIGGMLSLFVIIRLINGLFQYNKFKNGILKIDKEKITIQTKTVGNLILKEEDITYLELNLLGDLIIRDKNKERFLFPLMLLSLKDQSKLLSFFKDLAPKRTIIYKKVWEFVDSIVVALIIAVHIIQYIVQAYYIPTGSMEDTLLVGDHLFVEKITYGPIIPKMFNMEKPIHLSCLALRKIERGDIVIFRPPHEIDKDYIKRCVALPGDKVEIKNGSLYINDQEVNEPYVKGKTYDDFGEKKIQGIVPEGKVVVLGDNRENSSDGRFFGYLNIEEIKGKALFLYWNTDQIKKLDFSRFGLIR